MPEQSHDKVYINSGLRCKDLPTTPLKNAGKILITGASGYIGGRLIPELIARGYQIRIMVRGDSENYKNDWPDIEIVEADALNIDELSSALDGIDTAYYLIHSMQLGIKQFEDADILAAKNFSKVAEGKKLKRIIYLGGLGDKRSDLSSHLKNRIEVSEELTKGNVAVTILNAAIIIGSGSASYEIVYNLVKRLPFIIIPHWANNKCQPISVRDVIKYLVGVLEVPETAGKQFDIGGKDILTYHKMLETLAKILNKKITFISASFDTLSLYAYGVSMVTPVPFPITQCLIQGLKNEVVCQNNSIQKYVPFETLTFKESTLRAMTREEQDQVYTRWSDAYPPAHELALKLKEINYETKYRTSYSINSDKIMKSLFYSICEIGGKEGWFESSWMWRLRGKIDRTLTGVGTQRGRKSSLPLRANDVIDFWRVESIEQNKLLLLRAEMFLPGKAWLEFRLAALSENQELTVTAYYDTHTVWGRAYWYLFLPFHYFIFKNLIKGIEKRSS